MLHSRDGDAALNCFDHLYVHTTDDIHPSVHARSKPLAAVVSRRIFLLMCLLISCLQFYRAAMAFLSWPTAGGFVAAALRLKLHHPAAAAGDSGFSWARDGAGTAGLGLLRDGCMLPPAALVAVGEASVAAVGAATFANGYYLAAAVVQGGASAHQEGAARWTLEAASDVNGTSGWTPVGASGWRLNPQVPKR
jgi:hypothetical protein